MIESNTLTHLDSDGNARMVDVSDKDVTKRIAIASASITMTAEALNLINECGHKKGDVFAVARVAGIQGAKRCSDLIPLCHPLALSAIELNLTVNLNELKVEIESKVKLNGRTGVEMEALTAVSVAALTIYDMCKAVDKHMVIGEIKVQEKRGGKSGDWRA